MFERRKDRIYNGRALKALDFADFGIRANGLGADFRRGREDMT